MKRCVEKSGKRKRSNQIPSTADNGASLYLDFAFHRVINRSNDAAIILTPPTFDIMLLTFLSFDADIFTPAPVAKVKAANREAKPTANASNLITIE